MTRSQSNTTANFDVIRRMSEGLYVIRTGENRAMWTLRKLRKPSKCVGTCKQLHKGELHYGPVGNMDYRGWRLDRDYVESQVRA